MPDFFTDPIPPSERQVPDKPPIPDTSKTQPPGVVPRRAQVYVIAGLAGLLLFVMFFAGNTQPRQRKPAVAQNTVNTLSPDRIKQFEKELNDEAERERQQSQQLTAANRSLEQQLGQGASNQIGGLEPGELDQQRLAAERGGAYPLPYPGYRETGAPAAPISPKTQIARDRAKKDYTSLFASNVALTYRDRTHAAANTEVIDTAIGGQDDGASTGSDQGLQRLQREVQPAQIRDGQPSRKVAHSNDDLNPAGGKSYRLFEGTIIETVLTNRLDGGFAGPVNCMVTTDVYSHDNEQLLIPQGSRMLGEVKPVNQFGQQRLAVVFHRLIMPDGYSVSLDQFHGLSQIGETGLRDKVNHHYAQIFGVSLALGAIGGLTQIGNNFSGYGYDPMTQYRTGVTQSLSESAYRILDRFLNVLPAFTIREGTRVKIYLSDDLSVPAYSQHTMPAGP